MNKLNRVSAEIQHILTGVKGIERVCPLHVEDRRKVLSMEEEAEKRSLMGLGKVTNSGVREVLQYVSIYVALTNLDFAWGHCATLVLKKGDQVVGEEVYDEAVIAKLSETPNAWFMHKNFVIYKDRVSFPKDIMQKVCHFEIPSLPADWLSAGLGGGDGNRYGVRYANPSTLCDVYLKENYFDGTQEQRGLGTILIGVNPIADTGVDI